MVTWTDIKVGSMLVRDWIRNNTLGINETLVGLLSFSAYITDDSNFGLFLAAWIILGSIRVIKEDIIMKLDNIKDRILCEHEYNRNCVKEEVVGV